MKDIVSLWFYKSEYDARLACVQSELAANDLDGLITFQSQIATWQTEFFTRGYGRFQCAIIPATGTPTIVCRDVEEHNLDATCAFTDRAM